ncbi:MAG: hypothetical protein HY693_01205 [Deltaproteobacteria bacterium]|nr:hypothetical protein [Deltaproteobacteria bacterium]
MKDLGQAEYDLQCANKIRCDMVVTPVQLSNFYRSQADYDLCRLEESIKEGNQSVLSEERRKAGASIKMLVKTSRKAAQNLTETFRLAGRYYWLIHKQKKALRCWHKAIMKGERLGARLELSRVYFEIGKHLLEAGSKYKTLNGLSAEGYLEKARILFEEMDLLWDLDALSRVVDGSETSCYKADSPRATTDVDV